MRTMKIVAVGLFLTLTLACKKDDEASDCEKLKGTWQCESWQEDGEEFLGPLEFILSADIEFKALDGSQGDYEMNINYLIGGNEMIIGAYVVNASCDQVTITPKGGSPSTYNFSFVGDDLILEGTINTIEIDLRFRRE